MNRVKELFGVYCHENADLTRAVERQICPYSKKKCYKTRKSAPETAIGTCTVSYQNNNVIICPNRLLESNRFPFAGFTSLVPSPLSIRGGFLAPFAAPARRRKRRAVTERRYQGKAHCISVEPEARRNSLARENGRLPRNAGTLSLPFDAPSGDG